MSNGRARGAVAGAIAAAAVVVAGAMLLALARGEDGEDGEPAASSTSAAATTASEAPPTSAAPSAAGVLAYSREAPDGEDVWVRDLASGTERRLTATPSREFDPDVSPDGRLVAYRSNPDPRSDEADIWVVGVDGSAPRNLTRDPSGNNWAPAWSPDGELLAFTSTREDGTLALWTMRPDGADARRVTEGHCEYADWAPDGTRLVCSGPGTGGGTYDLWVVDAATGAMRQLTGTPETEFAPVWSPDGSRIAFQAADGEAWFVETIAPDGSGRTRVSPGQGSDPFWSPAGALAWSGPGGMTVLDAGATEPRSLGDVAGRLPSWASR